MRLRCRKGCWSSIVAFCRRAILILVRGDVWYGICIILIVTIVLTGMALYNISLSYKQAGKISLAVECAREALRIWQAALPPGHRYVVDAEELVRRLEQALQ